MILFMCGVRDETLVNRHTQVPEVGQKGGHPLASHVSIYEICAPQKVHRKIKSLPILRVFELDNLNILTIVGKSRGAYGRAQTQLTPS